MHGKAEMRKKFCEKKRRAPGVAAVLLLLLLCSACGETAVMEETLTVPETQNNRYYYSGTNLESFEDLQNRMEEAGCGFTVAKLGTAQNLKEALAAGDGDLAEETLREELRNSRLLEEYPFLSACSADRVIDPGEGSELFCVIPERNVSSVTVSHTEADPEGNPQKGTGIAVVEGAFPLLILGEGYYISGEGGRETGFALGSPELSNQILDITYVPEVMTEADLLGVWKAGRQQNDAGAYYDLYLEFAPGGSLAFFYSRYNGLEKKGETLLHRSGTWKHLYDDVYAFELTTDGGYYRDLGAPEDTIRMEFAAYFLEPEKQKMILSVRAGDSFMEGLDENEMIFERTE